MRGWIWFGCWLLSSLVAVGARAEDSEASHDEEGEQRLRIHVMASMVARAGGDDSARHWRYGAGFRALLGTRDDTPDESALLKERMLSWGVLVGYRALAFRQANFCGEHCAIIRRDAAQAYDLGVAFDAVLYGRKGGVILGIHAGPSFTPGTRVTARNYDRGPQSDENGFSLDGYKYAQRPYAFGFSSGARFGYATPKAGRSASFTAQLGLDLRVYTRGDVYAEPQLLFGFSVN